MPRITKAMLEAENERLRRKMAELEKELEHKEEVMAVMRAKADPALLIAVERISDSLAYTLHIMKGGQP